MDNISNLNIKLDHIFIWVKDHLAFHSIFEEKGFIITSGEKHFGQGTIGSYINFNNMYLEIVSIIDKEEFENNVLYGSNKNESQFGIGFYFTNQQKPPFETFDYRDEWLEKDCYIKIANTFNTHYNEPMLFIIPDYLKIIQQQIPKKIFNHKNGIKNLMLSNIYYKNNENESTTLREINKIDNLNVKSSDYNLLELIFDNGTNHFDFRPELPLVIKY